jgi:hypothetical protein
VPNIKAAEDLNPSLWSPTTASLVTCSPLHTPHQPSDLTLTKLIVLPIGRRKPKAREPVAAIVMQVMGDFIPEVLKSLMFSYVISVCFSRLGGSNRFSQGCKSNVFAIAVASVQTMSHLVRHLCPSPDIALECIS